MCRCENYLHRQCKLFTLSAVLSTESRANDPTSGSADATPSSESSPGDGRTARGARARKSIAEALISLLEQGVGRPTARQVAERAGVSLRLVFHHFEDMESLLESAVSVQVERHWGKLESVCADGELRDRVAATVNERARLFEAIAPVRRAAGQASEISPTLGRQLESSRTKLRSQLCDTFASELSNHAGNSHQSVQPVLDALEVATSFETWDQLRRLSGRSIAEARRVVEHLAMGALGPTQPASRTTSQDRS